MPPETSSSRSSITAAYSGNISVESGKRPEAADHRTSSIERAMEKVKSKLGRKPSGAETLPEDDEDFEKQKAKELEKQKRKAEYERLGLGDRTKFGLGGAGGFKAG